MLISHGKKFIYLKTVKTGGTSTEIFLEKHCKPSSVIARDDGSTDAIISEEGIVGYRGTKPGKQTWFNHMPAKRVRELVGADIWSSYHKFCIVRNPFDRLVSLWWMRLLEDPPSQAAATADITAARDLFSAWILGVPKVPTDRLIYTIDGLPCVDRMIRYETLQEDLASTCRHLGITEDPSSMGRFKGGYRARKEGYQSYYTAAARGRVEAELARDLEMLSYQF